MAKSTVRKLSRKEFAAIYGRVPRLCVDAVIRTRAGIVLAKRDITPWKGKWHLPGGTVRMGERLADALARVVREETGLTVKIQKPLGIIEYFVRSGRARVHSVSAVFLVSPVRGTLRGSPQGREVGYFSSMPKNLIAEQRKFLKTIGKSLSH